MMSGGSVYLRQREREREREKEREQVSYLAIRVFFKNP
jgi:hypothetical protein